jgi:hypothetical protein
MNMLFHLMGQHTMNCSQFGQARFVSQEQSPLNEILTLSNYCWAGSLPTSLCLMLFKPLCHQTYICAVQVAGPAYGSLNNVKWVIGFIITSRTLPGMLRILNVSVNYGLTSIPVISAIVGSWDMTDLSDIAPWRTRFVYSAGVRCKVKIISIVSTKFLVRI